MHQSATYEAAPLVTSNFVVAGNATTGYEIFDGPDRFAVATTPRRVLDEVFGRAYRRAFELASLKGWVRFHGAVVTIGGARIAIVGPSRAGKTTLALALLARGHGVETDESFIARGADVMAVARRLHVKPGWVDVVPDATFVNDAPVLDGTPPLRAVDPTEHGFPWRLTDGPIDQVVLLSRTDAVSRMDPVGASAAVQLLIDESFAVTETRSAIVRQAAALVRGRAIRNIVNGSDGNAVSLIERLIS